MKCGKIAAAVLAASLLTGAAFAMDKPVLLSDQGSFEAGGTVVTTPGTFDNNHPLNQAGQTLHGDHAYVFYQKPAKAHKNSIVFLHGHGQSGKTWETTPDGRDGFQNIFLEKGYNTYVVDQPRRGKAGQSTNTDIPKDSNVTLDQFWFNNFRIGHYPKPYDNAQVPRDAASQDQFLRMMTPDTGAFDANVVSDAMAAVLEKSGPAMLITHSQGGGLGWLTAIKSRNVQGIVSLEPGSGFLFPEGETPEAESTISPLGPLKAETIPQADFEKLTKFPILILYGDHIPSQPSKNWNEDTWRIRLNMARKWAETVNRHGGDAQVIYLPDIGIYGNTHFIMSDLNNKQIANLIGNWFHQKKLDK